MSAVWIVVGLVALQRLAELFHGNRNTRRLIAQGAVEIGAGHYPLIVGLHTAWLAAILILVPEDAAIHWPYLILYLGLQVLRVWTLASLGRFWTTRIITLPDAPLARIGPYRFCRHPNYLIVAGEIATLPLVFGLWRVAMVFSILNLAVTAYRIRIEDSALAARRTGRLDSR